MDKPLKSRINLHGCLTAFCATFKGFIDKLNMPVVGSRERHFYGLLCPQRHEQ